MSVFTDAIRVLEERGWHQGGYGPGLRGEEGSSVCVLGAIALANGYTAGTGRLAFEFHRREERVLGRVIHSAPHDVPAWNDDPRTSYEDVVPALKRAHELAEAE